MDRRSFLVGSTTGAIAISNGVRSASSGAGSKLSILGIEDIDAKLRTISEKLETYLFEHCFDPDGILYAYIDVQTGKPFSSEYMSTQYLDLFHVPNPVHYWSNEDSMQYSGYLLAALYEKYMATKDSRVIEQMNQIYRGIKKVYDLSQSLEPNSFSRPYGGLQNMARYKEPLGTDQAQSLFWGLWLFRQLADERLQPQIDEMNLKTLEWYRKQDYSYLYYQMVIHGSRAESMRQGPHSLCYYAPCALWAYKTTGDANYYKDYLRLWEEQWYQCSEGKLNVAWKHRHNLRWLKDLAPEKEFWQRFHERCINIDISLFNGKEQSKPPGENEGGEGTYLWLLAPIAENGLSYEWRGASDKNFKTGLTQQERGWLTEWRSASRKQKVELLRLMATRKGWFPGEKRNLYRHRAQMLPVAKIKDITMAALYDNRGLDYLDKAKKYLAKYDELHSYGWVIDPEHTLIPEKDIEFPSRTVSSGFLSFWLLAYWTLQRLERR